MFSSHFLTCRRLGRHGSKGDKGDRGRPADDTSVPQTPMVGFSATLDQNLPRSGEYRVVRFNVVLTNHAAAYEPSTGKFTAPLNGSARPDPTDSKPNPTRPDPTTPRTSRPPASSRRPSSGQPDPTRLKPNPTQPMGCLSTGKFTAPVNGSYLVGFSGVAYDGQDILLHQNPYFRKYVNFLIEQYRIRRRRSHA